MICGIYTGDKTAAYVCYYLCKKKELTCFKITKTDIVAAC
jgi:hypothetical protein